MMPSAAYGFDYSYAPSVIYAEGAWHAYFCSSGPGVGSWDYVRHSISPDHQTWGAPAVVMQSSNPTNERAACDPSVVRFDAGDGPYYYLFYSGNFSGVQTVNFVSRSASPNGPFLKFTERGTWEASPSDAHVITWPMHAGGGDTSGYYGAGQSSVVVMGNALYMFYMDDTQGMPGPSSDHIYVRTAWSPTTWGPPILTNVASASVDVKYDDTQHLFTMFEIVNEHQATSALAIRTSVDGITWTRSNIICGAGCFPSWANNVGASGSDQGHLFGQAAMVAYGAPYGLSPAYVSNDCAVSPSPYCWAHWDLYSQVVTFDAGHVGPIAGNIDGLSWNGANWVVNGWACAQRDDASINVDLYIGGPAGVGTGISRTTANLASEPAVASACMASGNAYRFSIALDAGTAAAHPGEKIYVHGIMPADGENLTIDGSGGFFLPGNYALNIAAGGNPLWPAANVLPMNRDSCFSGQPHPDGSPAGEYLAAWLAAPKNVGSVYLMARAGASGSQAFPTSYSIYVTDSGNTAWIGVGTYAAQPAANGLVGIALPAIYKTWGVMIIPQGLGLDDNGTPIFQVCGLQVGN
jgi:hypothetical protein